MIAGVVSTRPFIPADAQQTLADKREADRLAALLTFSILDTKPEPAFDDLVLLAARVCQAPMAVIGFMDAKRYWVKAQIGLKLDDMPREYALYSYSTTHKLQEVPDTQADNRLADHPMVLLCPKIRFYVGVPILTPDNQLLGVLEVMDRVPRRLDDGHREALTALVRQVLAQ